MDRMGISSFLSYGMGTPGLSGVDAARYLSPGDQTGDYWFC